MVRSRLYFLFLAATLAWAGTAVAAGMPEGDYTDKHARSGEEGSQNGGADSGRDAAAGESNESYEVVRNTGHEAPLRAAERALLPSGGCWRFLIQRGLEDREVSWGRGAPWPTVVRRMAAQAGLEAAFNYQDCIVAIGSSRRIATHMAKTGGNVWHVREDQTIKAVLERWAERAGWQLAWDPGFTYDVEYSGTLVGQFYGSDGSDGVLARVLRSYDNAPNPLVPIWKEDNRVVRVAEKTAKMEQ